MYKIFPGIFILLFLFACGQPKEQIFNTPDSSQQVKDSLFTNFNQDILVQEIEDIELLIQRYGWQMQKTETGLHYMVTKEGIGAYPTIGDEVTLKYETSLLSGETIYNSKDNGMKRFTVEKTEEITGLHEAVQLLKSGSSATLIIPSYLAYGLTGDGDKIGNSQPIIMKIEMNIVSK